MQGCFRIYVKGMVCDRCILVVKEEILRLQMPVRKVQLGEIAFFRSLSDQELAAIRNQLIPQGFTVLEDKKEKLVRELKWLVREVYAGDYDFEPGFTFSSLVISATRKDYETISAVFVAQEGITLERFIISYRISRVKELLIHSNFTLSLIAFKLGYSSAAHLSNQFRNETGMTASHFRKTAAPSLLKV